MNENDRRGIKAASLRQLTRTFKNSHERGENGTDFSGKTMADIGKLVKEASPERPLSLTEQWFFFTPDEVKKTNDEITNCTNSDRQDFNDYVSDLKTMAHYFRPLPRVYRKMLHLIHDLCPANSPVARAVPVAEAEEASNLPVAETILDGGRRKSRGRRIGGNLNKRKTKRLRKSLRKRRR
jgi:hypothetical protein